nr:phage tail protein [Escherichia coli]
MPVGVPVPWPTATPPAGWLKCDGRAFTKEQYPVLTRGVSCFHGRKVHWSAVMTITILRWISRT